MNLIKLNFVTPCVESEKYISLTYWSIPLVFYTGGAAKFAPPCGGI
ncbi:hypothetical protein [uncultured Cytophaga sp.]|nr:hypothetical protein [uncultured Cytophaga sp.]